MFRGSGVNITGRCTLHAEAPLTPLSENSMLSTTEGGAESTSSMLQPNLSRDCSQSTLEQDGP